MAGEEYVSSPDGDYLLLYLTRKNPLRFKISFTCKWDSLSSEVIDRRRESFFLMLIWGHLEWYADFTVGSWGSKWYYKMIHVITSKLKKSESGYSQEFYVVTLVQSAKVRGSLESGLPSQSACPSWITDSSARSLFSFLLVLNESVSVGVRSVCCH